MQDFHGEKMIEYEGIQKNQAHETPHRKGQLSKILPRK